MDAKLGIFVILMLGGGSACAARLIAPTDFSIKSTMISHIQDISWLAVSDMATKRQGQESHIQDEFVKNNQVCTLCEEFAAQALDYISANKTQSEIVEILHHSCTRVPTFQQQCVTLVDYYAPLFFFEVSSIQPDTFCQKVNLCTDIVAVFLQVQEDSCRVCQRAMSEVMIKLKDPDTQLEIIEILLKACNSMDNNAKKCKKMVFEYGPLVLANAEQFLEKTDVCTMLHACSASGEQAPKELKADS